MATFGERLRLLRNELGLTQGALGRKFKISESAIGMYERDSRAPSQDITKEMADFFDVTIDFLMGRTDYRAENKKANGKIPDEIDPSINIAYLNGVKHELTPEVARRLKEDIELFKRLKQQHEEDKQEKKK